MKKIITLLFVILVIGCGCKKTVQNQNNSSASEKKNLSIEQSNFVEVTSEEAKNYIGEEIIVKGKVSSVFTSKNGHTFINFDKRYPNHTFSAVKFKDSKVDISEIKEGNIIAIKGVIKSYQNKPEIILESQSQIISIE